MTPRERFVDSSLDDRGNRPGRTCRRTHPGRPIEKVLHRDRTRPAGSADRYETMPEVVRARPTKLETSPLNLSSLLNARTMERTLTTGRPGRRLDGRAASSHDRHGIRHPEHDGFDVPAEFRSRRSPSGAPPETAEAWRTSRHLAVGGAERLGVDRAGRYERCGHVPVAEHHPERGVAFTAHDRGEFGEVSGLKSAKYQLCALAAPARGGAETVAG